MSFLKFVPLSGVRNYFGDPFKSTAWYYFLQMQKLNFIWNYYSPISVIFIAITIYSAFDYFSTIELSSVFSLLTYISLKQPKLQFKIPPWEDASQTTMKNQNEAQFEEKAVKYFIDRNV